MFEILDFEKTINKLHEKIENYGKKAVKKNEIWYKHKLANRKLSFIYRIIYTRIITEL